MLCLVQRYLLVLYSGIRLLCRCSRRPVMMRIYRGSTAPNSRALPSSHHLDGADGAAHRAVAGSSRQDRLEIGQSHEQASTMQDKMVSPRCLTKLDPLTRGVYASMVARRGEALKRDFELGVDDDLPENVKWPGPGSERILPATDATTITESYVDSIKGVSRATTATTPRLSAPFSLLLFPCWI